MQGYSRSKLTCAALLLVLGLAWLLRGELPRWTGEGTRTVELAPVGTNRDLLECPPVGSVLALHGDSHVSGARMDSGDSANAAFPAVMQTALSGQIDVIARGAGGATAAMGERRWRDPALAGDTIVLAFGTNDAAPRGWLGDRQAVTLQAFGAALERQVQFWQQQDRQVVLLAPPPPGSRAMGERLAPYRRAVGDLGVQLRVPVLDPADAFAQCDALQPLLVRDALHMNAAGHRCLGQWLAAQFCPAG